MIVLKNVSIKLLTIISFLSVAVISCKKNQDAKLPTITFKTGGNYTSYDANVITGDLINIGTTSDKNESDLKTFKIYSAIGVGAYSLKKTFHLTPDEKDHYENDYEIKPTTKGTYETWKFEITDAGGNSNSVSLKLTIH